MIIPSNEVTMRLRGDEAFTLDAMATGMANNITGHVTITTTGHLKVGR